MGSNARGFVETFLDNRRGMAAVTSHRKLSRKQQRALRHPTELLQQHYGSIAASAGSRGFKTRVGISQKCRGRPKQGYTPPQLRSSSVDMKQGPLTAHQKSTKQEEEH